MKNTVTIVISIAFILLLTQACEKDKSNGCLNVKSKITTGSSVGYINYSYDKQGRLTKTDWGDGLFTTYTYSKTQVTEQVYANSLLNGTTLYSLNSDGNATSSTYTKANASGAESITTYEYDYDGYLEHKVTNKIADANDVDETWYYYYDGNLTDVERQHTKTGYEYYSYTENEYYADKVNTSTTSLSFLGKLNTNLLKTTALSINYSDPINTLYTYETNADGLITKMTTTIGTSVTITEPEYNCD